MIDKNFWKDKNVIVTGHTGFKGSWLCLWLKELGANVVGYSKEPPTIPNHYALLQMDITSIVGDTRDKDKLISVFKEHKPEIIFHLAAQPIVRYSYNNPVETLETNIMGTINIFEACRFTGDVRAIVNITSDKCYENKGWVCGYRETDELGGHDPYSVSKACAELITNSYRVSYFNLDEYGKSHKVLLASTRAGNVIGGGDWAVDRLIPDIMKSANKNETVIIRSPRSTRPWQHVLEPLSGYMMLAQRLFEGKKEFAGAWNFGPYDEGSIDVESVVEKVALEWNKVKYEASKNAAEFHETSLLKLDCSKAYTRLGWKPVWGIKKAISMTVGWYKEFYEHKSVSSKDNIKSYMRDMEPIYDCR
ncbi:MAG: CDP-glucose 4,6-dehydratase [Nitrospirae bacterium]|nr:CDP-glucose 4,6-dehydratase [Nitrospirota bacterium]